MKEIMGVLRRQKLCCDFPEGDRNVKGRWTLDRHRVA